MCIALPLEVQKVFEGKAQMSDGRIVRIGDIADVVAGDYLEVYADIAVAKVDRKDVAAIHATRKKGVLT